MKNVNIMKFVANASEDLAEYKIEISKAETYDAVKRIGTMALGYVNCMITFSNGLICLENNDITGMLDDVEQEWIAKIYQAVIDRAVELDVDADTIFRLCQKRDEHRD